MNFLLTYGRSIIVFSNLEDFMRQESVLFEEPIVFDHASIIYWQGMSVQLLSFQNSHWLNFTYELLDPRDIFFLLLVQLCQTFCLATENNLHTLKIKCKT